MNYQIVTVVAMVQVRPGDARPKTYVSESLAAKSDVEYIFSCKERDVEADEWAEYMSEKRNRD